MTPPFERKGFTIWFTGLSGAGKSTLAEMLFHELRRRDMKVELLDGDIVRTNLSKGLGFSKEDRYENIRRIGFVAGLLARHGVTVLVSAISPYRAVRDEVRAAVTGDAGARFVEVHVATPVQVCAERDVKGLYAKHARGELRGLTGVDDPYEAPLHHELVLRTEDEPAEASAERVGAYLAGPAS